MQSITMVENLRPDVFLFLGSIPLLFLVEIKLICINEKKKHAFVWIVAIGTVLSMCIE